MKQLGAIVTILGAVLALLGIPACGDSSTAAPSSCSTVLLVVDVQNVYVNTLDLTTIDGVQLVPQLVTVLATARAAGIPIVYIQHRDPRYAPGDPLLDTVCALAPLAGNPIVWKSHGDAFWDTGLVDVLTSLGVGRVLITGLATTGCVDATAFGARRCGYETWVVGDAHSGGCGLDGLAYYNAYWLAAGITVVNSDDVNFAQFGCPGPSVP